jgi:putative acetyltransferase
MNNPAMEDALYEIKSMRTTEASRGKGIASTLLKHILNEAKQQGINIVSLETGSVDFFTPARKLYAKNGFEECGPFADYVLDPFSVFMTKAL